MKNLFIMLIFFLNLSLSYQFTHSQVTQEWVQRYSGPGNFNDEPFAMAVDDSGNVYVTGYTRYNVFNGPVDYATIKYNSSGTQMWVQIYSGPGNNTDVAKAIALDNSGNVYVSGNSWAGGSSYDYATIKYSSSGAIEWVQTYNGPENGSDAANSIAVDVSGNVYVTGSSHGNLSGNDYATVKYNSSGIQQWVQRYNGPGNGSDIANSVKLDGFGNVYVNGNSIGDSTGQDYATIKYNSSGVQEWAKRYSGPGNNEDYANSITIDNSGNICVTGQSNTDQIRSGYATIKYSSSGETLWVRRYDASSYRSANSVASDSSGNFYVTGDPEFTTIKYSSSGDQMWLRSYNSPYNWDDEFATLAVDLSGNVYVTGSSNRYGVSHHDYATVKYNSSGVQQWVQTYNGTDYDDVTRCVVVDKSGNVYVTGSSRVVPQSYMDFATIKYSPQRTLFLTALIEGFYDQISDIMKKDTVRVYLRNAGSPYSIVDSAKSVLDSTGNGIFYFPAALNGTSYFIVFKHRNSIETWSIQQKMFSNNELSYDFTSSANKAYGDNLVLKGSKYCIYSGDVTQDGMIDISDLLLIQNKVINFLTGYEETDVNGDNITDLNDILIAYYNSVNFVSSVTPQ